MKPFFSFSSSNSRPVQSVKRRSSQGGDKDTTILHILSWNIDGLSSKFTCERADVVCDIIDERKPEIVYLQEIVKSTWELLQWRFSTTYFIYRDNEIANTWHYFCVLLVRKKSAVLPESIQPKILRFPSSQQNRYLLQMHVRFRNISILLLTSHLESLVRYSGERKKQLKTCFRIMKEEIANNPGSLSILGGDLNLMENELAQISGLPENFYDVWESCGAEADQKYTWDSSEPRFRLDRFCCCASEDMKLTPTFFELLGREVLGRCGNSYPSDHLGLWAEFEIQ